MDAFLRDGCMPSHKNGPSAHNCTSGLLPQNSAVRTEVVDKRSFGCEAVLLSLLTVKTPQGS